LVVVLQLTIARAGAQTPGSGSAGSPVPPGVLAAISQIVRADYESDLRRLGELYDSIPVAADTPQMEARLRYWKGFAAWRRAINGFNESVALSELAADTRRAIGEFERAVQLDPQYVETKIALISCYQLLTFFGSDAGQVKELVGKFVPLLKEAAAIAPDNPRLLWVRGQGEWYTPPGAPAGEVARRQSAAMSTYRRGLDLARRPADRRDDLEPSWAEAELLMNLAWSSLNGVNRDLAAAESYARGALRLVPHWRYVRDFLLPQILAAKG
jgi:hypothetical protein